MTAVLITALICATLIAICAMNAWTKSKETHKKRTTCRFDGNGECKEIIDDYE